MKPAITANPIRAKVLVSGGIETAVNGSQTCANGQPSVPMRMTPTAAAMVTLVFISHDNSISYVPKQCFSCRKSAFSCFS